MNPLFAIEPSFPSPSKGERRAEGDKSHHYLLLLGPGFPLVVERIPPVGNVDMFAADKQMFDF